MQLLSELSPKFCELARTDSLPDTFHGVKEERQIMMGQQDTRQHLAGLIKMSDERPRMTPTDRASTGLIEGALVQRITGILDIQFAS